MVIPLYNRITARLQEVVIAPEAGVGSEAPLCDYIGISSRFLL